jgi:cytoskeleton-associated protein 5
VLQLLDGWLSIIFILKNFVFYLHFFYRTAGDMMVGLITKCYGAPKVKTKDIAIKITLMFIEIEKQDVVIEELVKGMDHKFPKIISTCIRAATQAIK